MITLVVKRVAAGVVIILFLTAVMFTLQKVSPVDPVHAMLGAQASGNAEKFKGFAEECMAEYDLDGWKVPDLSDPGALSYHVLRGRE